ncbi:MAG: hypothetical protein AAFW89_11595 [Bacteroidota bacterium]
MKNSASSKNDLLDEIISFIEEIGISIRFQDVTDSTFLPGIMIDGGTMIIDREKLAFPGDVLHEAGHIALTPAHERHLLAGDLDAGKNEANSLEMAAICWSYAAALHLNIDLNLLFHEEGYKGESAWLIKTFEEGNYLGLPLLQWMELCTRQDDTSDTPPFPYMIKWLRD